MTNETKVHINKTIQINNLETNSVFIQLECLQTADACVFRVFRQNLNQTN